MGKRIGMFLTIFIIIILIISMIVFFYDKNDDNIKSKNIDSSLPQLIYNDDSIGGNVTIYNLDDVIGEIDELLSIFNDSINTNISFENIKYTNKGYYSYNRLNNSEYTIRYRQNNIKNINVNDYFVNFGKIINLYYDDENISEIIFKNSSFSYEFLIYLTYNDTSRIFNSGIQMFLFQNNSGVFQTYNMVLYIYSIYQNYRQIDNKANVKNIEKSTEILLNDSIQIRNITYEIIEYKYRISFNELRIIDNTLCLSIDVIGILKNINEYYNFNLYILYDIESDQIKAYFLTSEI